MKRANDDHMQPARRWHSICIWAIKLHRRINMLEGSY